MKEIGNAAVELAHERRSAEYRQTFVMGEIEKWAALTHATNFKNE